MFSTNFLIWLMEWIHGRFEAASDRHTRISASHKAVADQHLAAARTATNEAERANKFAGKLANFLE